MGPGSSLASRRLARRTRACPGRQRNCCTSTSKNHEPSPGVPAARSRPSFASTLDPPKSEGAGNAGSWPPPWPACKTKSRRQLPQVRPDHPGIPCTMVLTLIARSPWEPGFLAPIAREIISRAWPQRREAGTTRLHVRFSAVRPHESIARVAKASIASRAQRS